MKKYLLSAIIASTVFFSAQVKAAPSNNDCKPTPPARDPKGTAHLPINNGVVFLMIAGIVIGVTTVNKAKSLKPVAVKA